MVSLLEQSKQVSPPNITQLTGSVDGKSFDTLDQLLLILPKKVPAALWRTLPQGNKLQALMRRSKPANVPAVATRLDNKRQTALIVGTADADGEAFEHLTLARKMVAALPLEKAGTLGICVLGFDANEQAAIASRVAAAALAAAFAMPAFKSKATTPRYKSLKLVGMARKLELGKVRAEAEGNNLARWLTAMPPNKLDATAYTKLIKGLAAREGWQFRKYATAELRKMGAGAFLAVAQGNADDSAAIVHLRYRPAAKSAKPDLSLVGKGIIFDTGGVNLKPFASMMEMHIDMGGSAVALGTLLALTRLSSKKSVDCWLAITENRIGPTAYKPQDVITALNGKTIQTIHTDAEGRMALADALSLASRDKPKLIIDYATLTGACINAVTTRYSGVFTNKPDLHPVLRKSGRDSGERVWPFPIGKEFIEELSSDTADIRQCAPNAGGDHILAASFLQEFVDEKLPWVHIDLSACNRKGGLGHIPTDITGFGVRFSLHLVIDKDVIGTAAKL